MAIPIIYIAVQPKTRWKIPKFFVVLDYSKPIIHGHPFRCPKCLHLSYQGRHFGQDLATFIRHIHLQHHNHFQHKHSRNGHGLKYTYSNHGKKSISQNILVVTTLRDILDHLWPFPPYTLQYSPKPGGKYQNFSWFWTIASPSHMGIHSDAQNVFT